MGVQRKMKRQGNALKTMQLAGRKNSRRCAVHRHAARRGSQSAYKERPRRLTARRGNKGSDAPPPNQRCHPRSRVCFWRATCDRGTRQRTNQPPAHDRRDFISCPVGDDERHDVRSGHPIKNLFASTPVGGMVGVTNWLTFDEAKQAGCWQGACRI